MPATNNKLASQTTDNKLGNTLVASQMHIVPGRYQQGGFEVTGGECETADSQQAWLAAASAGCPLPPPPPSQVCDPAPVAVLKCE